MSEQTFTPAPVRERHEFTALSVRQREIRALPEWRPLRTPNGRCRLCSKSATRFIGLIPLCDGHFKVVSDLINHGETAATGRLIAEADEARKQTGTLRNRLRDRHAEQWPDRPITDWFPESAD